jgi:hypothetical protein
MTEALRRKITHWHKNVSREEYKQGILILQRGMPEEYTASMSIADRHNAHGAEERTALSIKQISPETGRFGMHRDKQGCRGMAGCVMRNFNSLYDRQA